MNISIYFRHTVEEFSNLAMQKEFNKKLKISVFNEVRKICEEVGETTKYNYDRKSMDLISELVWRKLKIFGEDLEAFAKHAKRSTIGTDDVKLLVRRNNLLKEHISKMAEEQAASKEPRKGKQKKETTTALNEPAGTSTENSATDSRTASPTEEPMDD